MSIRVTKVHLLLGLFAAVPTSAQTPVTFPTNAPVQIDTATIGKLNNVRIVDGVKFASIQAAINDLPSTGGVVDARGLEGSQTISSTITINKAVLLLLGAATFSGSADPMVDITVGDVHIEGLGAPKSKISTTAQLGNIIRVNAGLSNVSVRGLMLSPSGTAYTSFADSETNLDKGAAIVALGNNGSPIENLVVENCLIANGNTGLYLAFANGAQIIGNKFDWSPVAGKFYIAQALLASSRARIENNEFLASSTNVSNAIYVRSALAGIPGGNNFLQRGNRITNNVVDGAFDTEGINIFGYQTTVANNYVRMTNSSSLSIGISVYGPQSTFTAGGSNHNIIAGNTIDVTNSSNVSMAGIQIFSDFSSSLGAKYNLVSGNTIRTKSRGIIVSYNVGTAAAADLTGTVVAANTIHMISGGPTDGHGVSIAGRDIEVSGNVVDSARTNAAIGINIAGTDTTRISARNNRVMNQSSHGIHLDTVGNDSVISGNYLLNNAGWGIVLGTPSGISGVQIGLNYYSGNTSGEVNSVGSSPKALDASGLLVRPPGDVSSRRYKADGGTALGTGDFSLHGNWGSGASAASVVGSDQGFEVTVISGSSGTGANPTLTLTFKDGTWTNPPVASCGWKSGGSGALQHLSWTAAASTLVITYNGTPGTSQTFPISCVLMGR